MPKKMSMEALFSALADRTRLRLLSMMADMEICVCYFVEALDAPQPTISRHLAYLRDSGVVDARKDGRWVHYRIAELPFSAERVLRAALEAVKQDPDIKADRARLKTACCSPQLVGITDAPQPTTFSR